MAITGIVFVHHEDQIATLETVAVGDYLMCSVIVNGNPVIRFPLPVGVDANEVALRTGNIINQTGLVANPCRVEAENVP